MAVRSEESKSAILEATLALLDERRPESLSLQKLSIERIAREAGVSKTTIYRWWPTKAALVIDTFIENHVARTPIRADVPAIKALGLHMASLAKVYSGPEGRLIAQLLAECQFDDQTLIDFKTRFWNARAAAVTTLIQRAIHDGDIRPDLDPSVVLEMLYSPIYFRLLFQVGPLNAEFTQAILKHTFEGLHPKNGA